MMLPQHNYVISLTNAHSRRAHIEQEFGKQGISFSFFDAITPDNMEETAKSLGIDISQSPLTRGEIACALSHITVWNLAKQKNLDYICIFEDDIYLGKNANLLLNINYLPENTHILKLETYQNDRLPKFFKTEKTILGRKLFRLTHRHVGMAGYILTKKGIDFLTEHIKIEILEVPIDDYIFERYLTNNKYHALQITPAICIQDFFLNKQTNFVSSLDEERAIRCNASKKKKKTILYKIYRELNRPISRSLYKFLNKHIPFK